MKILLVHDIGRSRGGAEAVVRRARDGLAARGHEVRLLAGDAPPPQEGFAEYRFHSGDSTKLGKLVNHLWNPWARRALRAALADFRPDIVHLHTVTRLSPTGLGVLTGRPVVMTFHDYSLLYPLLGGVLTRRQFCGYGDGACCGRHAGRARFLFESVRVRMFRRRRGIISAYIVPSGYVQDITEGLDYSPAITLDWPVDLSGKGYDGSERREGSVLYAGRLEPEKGVMQLLECFAVVVERMAEARLTLAGTGSLDRELRDRVRRMGLEASVELTGHLNGESMRRLYRQARLLVMPSLWPEPFGLAGPEAMSYGVPVVGSGRGGMSSWLKDGKNGLVADPDDRQAFAVAVVRLLEDDELYGTLSENARKGVRRFAPERHARQLEDVYLDVLQREEDPAVPDKQEAEGNQR